MPAYSQLPQLPKLLSQKIYKTGQTRGADDDEIFQNRVSRASVVLIPYEYWFVASQPPAGEPGFEHGFIALVSPKTFFAIQDVQGTFEAINLELGRNLLIFYETRDDWIRLNPDARGYHPATRRTPPLGGEYVARISATTASQGGDKIIRGFTSTTGKGAGIRVYEYASTDTVRQCRLQLEYLYWLCYDSEEVAANNGMGSVDVVTRRQRNAELCMEEHMDDLEQLTSKRLINRRHVTVCPLCLEEISAQGFFNKMTQAEGRIVHDLTTTQLNLFHVKELRVGRYGHRPYNLGWGHHHCNVVVKDVGISETIVWMGQVINKNLQEGYI